MSQKNVCVLGGWCQGGEFDSPCGSNCFLLHLFSKINEYKLSNFQYASFQI